MTKTERHTGEYFAKLIETMIKEYGPEKFLVIIAGNAANMKAALIVVHEKYQHIHTIRLSSPSSFTMFGYFRLSDG